MKQNIEFKRCIDSLVRMLDKYGEEGAPGTGGRKEKQWTGENRRK